MSQHHDDRHAEHHRAVFEAGDHLGGADVAGDATDEEVTDALVEHELDRDTGVGARQHRHEWLLLGHGLLFENGQIFLERGQVSAYEARVAAHQLIERCVRR